MAQVRTKPKAWRGGTQSKNHTPSHRWEKEPLIPSTHRAETSKRDKIWTLALRIQVLVPPPAVSPPAGSMVPNDTQEFYGKRLYLMSWDQERSSPLSLNPGKPGLFGCNSLVLGSVPSSGRWEGRTHRCCTHRGSPGACGTQIFLLKIATI